MKKSYLLVFFSIALFLSFVPFLSTSLAQDKPTEGKTVEEASEDDQAPEEDNKDADELAKQMAQKALDSAMGDVKGVLDGTFSSESGAVPSTPYSPSAPQYDVPQTPTENNFTQGPLPETTETPPPPNEPTYQWGQQDPSTAATQTPPDASDFSSPAGAGVGTRSLDEIAQAKTDLLNKWQNGEIDRGTFLNEMNKLSEEAGVRLPENGSTLGDMARSVLGNDSVIADKLDGLSNILGSRVLDTSAGLTQDQIQANIEKYLGASTEDMRITNGGVDACAAVTNLVNPATYGNSASLMYQGMTGSESFEQVPLSSQTSYNRIGTPSVSYDASNLQTGDYVFEMGPGGNAVHVGTYYRDGLIASTNTGTKTFSLQSLNNFSQVGNPVVVMRRSL